MYTVLVLGSHANWEGANATGVAGVGYLSEARSRIIPSFFPSFRNGCGFAWSFSAIHHLPRGPS